jgi:arginase
MILRVPYHIDEYLPDLDLPLQADGEVTADLPRGDAWERLGVLYSAVAGAVAQAAGRSARPVVVSGDCTTSLGTVAGLQRAGIDVGIVWLDAHGDVQTLETTTSGYLGGLPLRLLAGYRPELIAAGLGLRPVAERRVLLVGARDLDPPEVTYLAGAPVHRAEVTGLDISGLPDGPLYVHVDQDVIDPGDVPGLRYPAPGGPGPAEVARALQALLGTGRVAAVGVACTWYPGHGAAARVDPYLRTALGSPRDH